MEMQCNAVAPVPPETVVIVVLIAIFTRRG